jgi:hypothetical protein
VDLTPQKGTPSYQHSASTPCREDPEVLRGPRTHRRLELCLQLDKIFHCGCHFTMNPRFARHIVELDVSPAIMLLVDAGPCILSEPWTRRVPTDDRLWIFGCRNTAPVISKLTEYLPRRTQEPLDKTLFTLSLKGKKNNTGRGDTSSGSATMPGHIRIRHFASSPSHKKQDQGLFCSPSLLKLT